MYPACEPPHRQSSDSIFRSVEEAKNDGRRQEVGACNLAHKNGHLYVESERDAKVTERVVLVIITSMRGNRRVYQDKV
jgi:hypothetical protein